MPTPQPAATVAPPLFHDRDTLPELLAALLPDALRYLRDREHADSITIDTHKWPDVPYDSGTWFIKKKHEASPAAAFRNADAAYLDLGPENSRRLRALPVWFTLRAYGKAGYRHLVKRCVQAADADAGTVGRFLQTLNDNGRYFLSPTTLNGKAGRHAAFVNWRTEERDIHWLKAELRRVLLQVRPTAPALRRPTSPLH